MTNLDNVILNEESIISIYSKIKEYHKKYLKKFGVNLPKLYNSNDNKKFSINALVLVYLYYNYPNTRIVSKKELTKFVRTYYPDTTDVQQARHLGAQSGFWIIAGGRDNIVDSIPRGSYKLHTLAKPYPNFKKERRETSIKSWKELKERYHNRCVTCGSEEGQPHYHWTETKTKLQKGHIDPNKKLDIGNTIPQCQKCNQADKNRWVYDDKGRVIKLADAKFVKNFDLEVRKKIYKILSREFGKGENKNV